MDKAERRTSSCARRATSSRPRATTTPRSTTSSRLAKVAKGTFYLYFRDKRSVFCELVDTLFERIGAAILQVDTRGDVEAQVKHNIRAIVAVLLDDPALTHILMCYAAGLDAAFVDKINSFYDGVRRLLTEASSKGKRSESSRPATPGSSPRSPSARSRRSSSSRSSRSPRFTARSW